VARVPALPRRAATSTRPAADPLRLAASLAPDRLVVAVRLPRLPPSHRRVRRHQQRLVAPPPARSAVPVGLDLRPVVHPDVSWAALPEALHGQAALPEVVQVLAWDGHPLVLLAADHLRLLHQALPAAA
jgi:hypothetical protein